MATKEQWIASWNETNRQFSELMKDFLNLENKRKYWELKFKKEESELKDLQGAYNIALEEINKLRKKLKYE